MVVCDERCLISSFLSIPPSIQIYTGFLYVVNKERERDEIQDENKGLSDDDIIEQRRS